MLDSDELQFKELKINPDRFCEGISKIGYKPTAAIMDIVDNAIAAGAHNVAIELVTRSGTTNTSAGNVEMVRVFDDGRGMDSDQIEKALEIGGLIDYPAFSLSKFGFGLKSAGFSLGRRIQVTSKTNGTSTVAKVVDRDVIRDLGIYGVCNATAPDSAQKWLSVREAGTIVEIGKIGATLDSASKIRTELFRRLGVTYYHFLNDPKTPLIINVVVGRESREVAGLDILFWEDAVDQFDPDYYDGKAPCRVFDGTVEQGLTDGSSPIKVRMVVFPMDKMKNYPLLSAAEKKQISEFLITRENSGVFFYRNGRLIRWGDKVGGVQRDDIGFRATVEFTTEHDEMFHVDVSKQNLDLNEDFEDRLMQLCRTPLLIAREAFALCKKMLKLGSGTEGEAFNDRTETFEEADSSEDVTPLPNHVKEGRIIGLERESQVRESIETAREQLRDDHEVSLPEIATSTKAKAFERVRYSDKIIGLDVAVPGTDRNDGTYVRINRNHPFYSVVLSRLEPSDSSRLAIEALLWASAVAEAKASENVADVPFEQLREAFSHYRRVLAQTLDVWVNRNEDIF